VHLVGFIIRIYHNTRSSERQIGTVVSHLFIIHGCACVSVSVCWLVGGIFSYFGSEPNLSKIPFSFIK